ncbi:MAG: GNAT family N-acetyltransferase [Dongiaceae bacterium]
MRKATPARTPAAPKPTLLERLELRPYTTADRAACQRIAGSSTDYGHAVDANADAIEVAVLDGAVVGFAYIQVWSWNRVGWLGDIVIQHEKRNQGIGGRLLRRIEERARDLGCRVVMDHPPVNHPAIGYYLKRGYRICGYNDRFFADSKETTAIFVCKELS